MQSKNRRAQLDGQLRAAVVVAIILGTRTCYRGVIWLPALTCDAR